MDFPIFHLDFIGNRMLIAVTAIIHVIVNHPMAVGAVPLVTFLEWRAFKTKNKALDELAYKITFVFFIITTSLGALTGVGIWFSTALVNPDAIGSLLRVFFWGWFSEWIVFVIEVCMIMVYFLTWKSWTGEKKVKHIRTGVFLGIFSWITMAIITAVLGFMMNTGEWVPYFREWAPKMSLATALFNPLYLPQLFFRTPFALMTAGLFFMFLVPFFTKNRKTLQAQSVKLLSLWTLFWLPLTTIAAFDYWKKIPAFMAKNAPIAVVTQNYTQWYNTILFLLAGMVLVILVTGLVGLSKPRWLPRLVLLIPFFAGVALIGYFERVREFVRKPFVIQDYMYANGLKVQDYPLYQEDGILAHASFVSTRTVTEENKVFAGRDLFLLTCSRCHTVKGVNSVHNKFADLFPDRQWEEAQISAYIKSMHNVRPFMPPFPGNQAELDALSSYIVQLQNVQFRIEGAQSAGISTAVSQ